MPPKQPTPHPARDHEAKFTAALDNFAKASVDVALAERELKLTERLAEILQERDLNPSALARQAGLPRDAVRDILTGRSKHPRADTIAKLAAALGVDAGSLIGIGAVAGLPNAPTAEQELPIRWEVAGGQWLAQDDLRDEPYGYHTSLRVKGYERIPQWLERVRGDSMSKRLPDGALVHVLDAIALRYEPRHGDLVVVVRSRAQGAFIERSIKEVALTPRGVELWPRSYNPRWREPLHLTQGVEDGDDVDVQIAAWVYTAYIPVGDRAMLPGA